MSSTSWRHIEGSFQGTRGTQIHYGAWTPSGKPKAILVIVHGIGEHSRRYVHVADHMARLEFAVWACDLRGHGKSGGKRGHVDSFDDYLADLGQLIRIARDHYPGTKTFLLGHSLGGLIAPNYAEKHPGELDGLIASAPALGEKMEVSPVKVFLAKTLSSIVPTFSTTTGLDPNLLSHDREVVREYVEDPMVHKVVTARWFTEYRRAQDETMRHADKLTLPCLVIQSGADGIVDPAVATEFFKRIKSSDKTLKVYEGFYHESLNEIGKESVLRDIDTWLSART
ncbi:alpha/beta hydrolase [[Eubacterium] cellulosolvens]